MFLCFRPKEEYHISADDVRVYDFWKEDRELHEYGNTGHVQLHQAALFCIATEVRQLIIEFQTYNYFVMIQMSNIHCQQSF